MRRVLIVVAILFLTGCENSPSDPKNVKHAGGGEQESQDFLSYGNGVYYFPVVGATFGNNLATFLSTHPCPTNFSLTGNGTGVQGTDEGYWVICR